MPWDQPCVAPARNAGDQPCVGLAGNARDQPCVALAGNARDQPCDGIAGNLGDNPGLYWTTKRCSLGREGGTSRTTKLL